ncbi:MAG: T9SS type A sorting domain-containing protein [Bacteroidales bacterium]|nr:T9SS type A sorting domain-containing protein [Bacteroidales bacterium]
MLAIDINSNGLKDLVLGDVDFPNLIALFNGGTADTAFMVAFDTLFPSGNKPVNLFDFPVPSFVDVDHDGRKDLLISSFDPQLYIPDNYQSVWFYRNTGSAYLPKFTFQFKRLFQDQMIEVGSGSYPVFSDFDQDGLTDLMVGCWGRYDSSYYHEGLLKSVNTGRIAWFRNTGGSLNPSFSLVTDDLGGLSSLERTGLYPAFSDLNGDGAIDLMVGQDDGTLTYLENSADGSSPPTFRPPVWKYQGIDVGESSTPQLFDFDSDGLADLIIGEKNGNLNYFQNTGTLNNPVFTFVTDSLGKVNVTNYQISYDGYSTPCFFRDNTGETRLLVGSEEGKVWYFDEIPADPLAVFPESVDLHSLITPQLFPLKCGWRTAPAIGFLTDSTWFDLSVGNWAGGINYFTHQNPPQVLLGIQTQIHPQQRKFFVYPNPADHAVSVGFSSKAPSRAYQLKILNLFGQPVIQRQVRPGENIPIHELPNGLYLVTLTDPAGKTTFPTQKLIVSR